MQVLGRRIFSVPHQIRQGYTKIVIRSEAVFTLLSQEEVNMFRSANPALRGAAFSQAMPVGSGDVMTLSGTINKCFILLGLVIAGAMIVWNNPAQVMPFFWPILISCIGLLFFLRFKKESAPIVAPVYAGLQGLMLGGISSIVDRMYPGIVIQAVTLTFGTCAMMLLAYKSGVIKPTENFKLGVIAATGGIFIIYMVSFIMRLFGARMPFIHDAGPVGIIFSLVVVAIAALNLILDFDIIERGAESGAARYMEWYAAFSLMVTLIWLYMEILRLLIKLRQRR